MRATAPAFTPLASAAATPTRLRAAAPAFTPRAAPHPTPASAATLSAPVAPLHHGAAPLSAAPAAASPASAAPGALAPIPAVPPRAAFVFSRGHGAGSETGPVSAGKTEIRPSAVASVNANAAAARDGGLTRFGNGDVQVSFVPRRSNAAQYRVIGTKTSGGNGKVFTSFPMSRADLTPTMLATANLASADVVDEPRSPR
jgi:hypothetical protein